MKIMSQITKDDVVKFIEGMTVLELSELVKELEGRFGVTAAAPVAFAAAGAAAEQAGAAAEEKTEFDAVPGAGLRQLFHRVPLEGGGVHDIVFAGFGMVHGKAVMMLAGDDDIFHPGVFSHFHPFFGVKLDRIELGGQLFVFLHWDFGAVHDPFPDPADRLPLPFPGRQGV